MFKKILIGLSLTAMVGSAFAQQTSFYSDGRPEKLFNPVSGLDHFDIKFLKNAQAGNEFEIQSSQLADSNGASDFVKEFAKEMITDHTAAKAEVGQVAMQKSLSVGGELPKPLAMKFNKLKSLHGAAFDNAYKSIQKEAHEMTIQLLKGEIDNGRDQDVKAAAVKMLPTVELHYKMLLSGKTMMGASASANGM